LARYLGAHPGVFMPDRKELNYFDRAPADGGGIDWYRRQFAAARSDQRAGEATPSYLASETAARKMAAAIPDARLIAILRHPVDRAYSHFWMARGLGYEERSFDDAVNDEFDGCAPSGLEYVAYGHYAEHLERLRAHFRDDAMLIASFEDLRTSPAAVFAACCRHIRADDTMIPSVVGERINRPLRQKSLALYRVLERWRNSRRVGFGLATRLAARNSVPFEPPAMEPVVRRVLLDHFAPYNAALADLLGRDLSAWDH
jgi:hypothetical protein